MKFSNLDMLEDFAQSVPNQPGEKWDNVFSEDILDHLFETDGQPGLDLSMDSNNLIFFSKIIEICQIRFLISIA